MRPTCIPVFIALLALSLILTGSTLPTTRAAGSERLSLPLLACPGCINTNPPPTTPPVEPPSPPDTSTYVPQMVALVNQARANVGCPVVTPNDILMRATQAWSETMARTGNYTHAIGGYYQSHGYPGTTLENIDAGADTPAFAFEDWMTSPAHKRNIEFCYPASDPSYDPTMVYSIGVGYKAEYWTLVIGWE